MQNTGLKVHSYRDMKAIQINQTGGPEVLEMAELPIPQPGPGQVLIRIEAIGVNFIEVYFRKGVYKAALPMTPGSEAAGTVEELGPGVTGFAAGDAVASTGVLGSYAEYALVPATQLVKVPGGLSMEQAAAAMLGNDGALSFPLHFSAEGGRYGAGACRGRRRGAAADANGGAAGSEGDQHGFNAGQGGTVA